MAQAGKRAPVFAFRIELIVPGEIVTILVGGKRRRSIAREHRRRRIGGRLATLDDVVTGAGGQAGGGGLRGGEGDVGRIIGRAVLIRALDRPEVAVIGGLRTIVVPDEI